MSAIRLDFSDPYPNFAERVEAAAKLLADGGHKAHATMLRGGLFDPSTVLEAAWWAVYLQPLGAADGSRAVALALFTRAQNALRYVAAATAAPLAKTVPAEADDAEQVAS